MKKKKFKKKYLKNKTFTVMFHVKFELFWNELRFMSLKENTLENNVNMFWKM